MGSGGRLCYFVLRAQNEKCTPVCKDDISLTIKTDPFKSDSNKKLCSRSLLSAAPSKKKVL